MKVLIVAIFSLFSAVSLAWFFLKTGEYAFLSASATSGALGVLGMVLWIKEVL